MPDEYDDVISAALPAPKKARPALDYQSLYQDVGKKYGVDPDLLYRQAKHESVNFNPHFVYGPGRSPKGAAGLAQFMPQTARQYGLRVGKGQDDRFDPVKSADAHARLMKDLIDKYHDPQLALSAYNSGTNRTPESARRAMQRIPETKNYVQKIAPQTDGYDDIVSAAIPKTAQAQQADPYDDVIAVATAPKAKQPTVKPSSPFAGGRLTAGVGAVRQPRGKPPQPVQPQPSLGQPATSSISSDEMRVMKGEQPVDRQAYARQQEAQYRLGRMQDESYRERQAREAKDAERQARLQPEIERQTKLYRQDIQKAKQRGGDANKWIAEFGTKAAGQLAELAPGDTAKIHSEAALRAAQEEGADRNVVSKTIQDIGAGFIGSAPELGAMALGVPPVAAFAAGSAIRSKSTDPMEVAKAAEHGGATGLAFETPGIGEGAKRIATKALGVGGTSAGLEYAQGASPREALTAGATNALLVGVPEVARAARFQHLQFGEVEVLPDQTGARTGKVRVAEVTDPTKQHFVKKSDLQGRGNSQMIPIKESASRPAESPVEPAEIPQAEAAQPAESTTTAPLPSVEPRPDGGFGVKTDSGNLIVRPIVDEGGKPTGDYETFDVFVEPEARRQGVATSLYREAQVEAERRGGKLLSSTEQTAEGRALHEGLGRDVQEVPRREIAVREAPARSATGIINLDEPVPRDALAAINRTFNQMVGPDIYDHLPDNPKAQDVIELLADMGLSDQIMQESVPKLRKLGYSRIGDVLITDEGLKFAPKELNPAPKPVTRGEQNATVTPTEARESIQPVTSEAKGAGTPAKEFAPKPFGIARVPVSELNLDPERFQFKSGHNQKGGTGSLSGVTKWDENLGGIVAVWRDPADGKTYVVNGHNRLEKAQELGVRSIDAKYIEAADAQEARAVGAKINIAEGQGTALDAATFFRDSGATEATLKAQGIPLTKAVARDGLALSKLDNFIFQAVKRGELAEEYGVAIGSKIENPDLQAQAYKAISKATEKGRTLTKGVVDEMLDAIGAAPRQTQTEQSLFGDFDTEKSLFNERAQVAAAIKRQLAGDRTLFGTAARRSGRLAEGGTKVDVEQAKQLQESAAEALGVFDTLKNRTGGISDILDEGARKVAAGQRPDAVAKETYGKIKQAVSQAIRGSAGTVEQRGAGIPESPKDQAGQLPLGEGTPTGRQGEAGYLNPKLAKEGVYEPASTPVLKEVERATLNGNAQRPSLRQYARRAKSYVQRALIAEFTPLRELEQTLYGKENVPIVNLARKFEQVAGAPAKAQADIIDFRRNVIDPIRKHADDFNSYLFLKRVEDRLLKEPERKRVADWTVEKAQAGLSELESKVGPETYKDLAKAGKVYQKEMDKALRLQVESGRMSQDLYDAIKESSDFYAPFKVLRYIEDSDIVRGSGRRIATTQELSKKIKGIDSEDFQLGNILQASAEQIVRSRILAEKNLKMLELDKLADLDPKGELIKRVDDKARPAHGKEFVRFLKDGEQQILEVDHTVADAVQGLNPKQAGLLATVMMKARKPLQVGATSANAGFQAVNLFFADLPRAALVSRYGVRNIRDVYQFPLDWTYSLFTSMKGNFGKPNQLYMEWLRSGAANSTIQKELTPEAFRPTLGIAKPGAKHLAKSVLNSVAQFSNAIEETSKVLGIKRGMKAEQVAKMSPAERQQAMEKIAAEVRNYSGSPDFARKGSETRDLNLLFMFFNARLQGVTSDLTRLAGKTGTKEGATAWARLGVSIGLPSALLAIVNNSPGNKEDYDKIPDWEKKNYWMIPRDSYFKNEDTGETVRDYWRIPKRELGQLIGNTTESAVQFGMQRDPKIGKAWGVDMIENLSPVNIQGRTIGERAESVFGSTNPALKLPAETLMNRDTFRHRDIVPEYMKKAAPAEQYRESTPRGYVRAGKALGVSPLQLEHAAEGLTGSAASQFSIREQQPGRSALGRFPLTKRFVRSGQTAVDETQTQEQTDFATKQLQRRRARQEAVKKYRAGQISKADLDKLEAEDTLTESDVKRVQKEAGMTNSQQRFTAIPPNVALDRFERMDARQRNEVVSLMEHKAYTLLNSPALTDAQKEAFKARIEALGITPRDPRKKSGTGFKGAFGKGFKNSFATP